MSLVCILIVISVLSFNVIQAFDGCLCVEEIAKDLRQPLSLVNANDGSNRIFITEQYGVVNIFYPNGTKLADPLIDISNKIGDLPKYTEEGLLDIAFHPNFESNGKFYMLFSTPSDSDEFDNYSNLYEFKISEGDVNKAEPNYERQLLKVPQPNWPHNANKLLFGTDNYLYIFIGDGGNQGDPQMKAQNMNVLLGKVLRIDVDSRTGNLPYGIPPDNPFNNGFYKYPEIYALGLRNPWRGGLDPGDRETGEGRGRIIIGDVGQNRQEELDLIQKGANYGWNRYEGNGSYCVRCRQGPGTLTSPIFAYHRNTRLGKSVIGGQFYRGCLNPALNGIYLWGDYVSGMLFSLMEDKATGTWLNNEVEMCSPSVCQAPLQSEFAAQILSFGLDEEGEMYLLSVSNTDPHKRGGHVYRLVDPSQRGDPGPCRGEYNRDRIENKPFPNTTKPQEVEPSKEEIPAKPADITEVTTSTLTTTPIPTTITATTDKSTPTTTEATSPSTLQSETTDSTQNAFSAKQYFLSFLLKYFQKFLGS